MGLKRGRLITFVLGFGVLHGVLGISVFRDYEDPAPAALGLVFYFVAMTWSVIQRGARGPSLMVLFCVVTSALTPFLTLRAIGSEVVYGHLIWFVTGIATLMAVLAARGNNLCAWAGMALMVVQVAFWAGPGFLINGGIPGALAILVAAQAGRRIMTKSRMSSDEFTAWKVQADADRVAHSAVRARARSRMLKALDDAMPLLDLIEEKNGELTKSDVSRLLLAEATIRDQIRAQGFQVPSVTASVLRARERGLTVQLLDDGGMEQLSTVEKARILRQVVKALDSFPDGRVVIRSAAGEAWTVTFFGDSDRDDVSDVFMRL